MNHLSDAESAYRAALAKSNLASAREREDLPALYPIVGAYSGLGHLQLMVAARSRSSEERDRARKEACAAFAHSLEIRRQISAIVSFSPSDFPVIPLNMAADSQTQRGGIGP